MKAVPAELKKFGLSAHALKLIAVLAMLLDHIGAAFVPLDNWVGFALRIIGRLTAPIMCFFIAEGFHRTRNVRRYALRLAVFAVISHFAFYYAWMESFPIYLRYGLVVYPTSVMFPLLFGLLALIIWSQPHLSERVKALSISVLCFLSVFGDWGPIAVLWILFFGIFHGDFSRQARAFSTITLVYCGVTIATGFGFPEQRIMGLIQLAGLLTLPLLRAYNGQLGKGGRPAKWFFYWFYPVHLLLIGLLKDGFRLIF